MSKFATKEQLISIVSDMASKISMGRDIYLEQTVTLSTSAQTTATFTDAVFTTTTCVDVAVSEWGLVPDDVTVTTGSCTVTFPSVDTARTVSVRVYVR